MRLNDYTASLALVVGRSALVHDGGRAPVMPRDRRTTGRTGGVIAASAAATMAVIAAAIGIVIWRYEVAVGLLQFANEKRGDAATSARLHATFWHEREGMTADLILASPDAVQEVIGQHADYLRLAPALTPETAAGRRALVQANAAQAALYSTWLGVRGAAGTTPARIFAAA